MSIKFNVVTGRLTDRKESLLLGVTEGTDLPPWASAWTPSIQKRVKELLRSRKFSGKLNETFLLPDDPSTKLKDGSRWLILVGAGKPKELTLDRVRQAAASATRRALSAGIEHFSRGLVQVPQATPDRVAQAVTEGTVLGAYRYEELKNVPPQERRTLKEVTLVAPSKRDTLAAKAGVRQGQVIAESVCWTRNLINRPANRLTPRALAQEAKRAGKRFGFKVRVLEPNQMRKLRMNAVLAVAQGSIQPAQFIIAEYRGPGAGGKKPLVFAGKGVTFDSGGLSLKTADKMIWMKYDMSGGAAVLGAVRAIAALRLPVSVVGLVPATENLPSGSAQKPGDVIRTITGKTVEVENTDAEGRLVLADALGYAQRLKPRGIVDVATLTGACIVALGHHAIGLMGNNPQWVSEVKKASEESGERVWELPLWLEYGEQIKSEVADLKNVGTDGAGTITAGYFLKEFAGEVPWAHLDIAGVAWSENEKGYLPKGASGAAVRLLVELATQLSQR